MAILSRRQRSNGRKPCKRSEQTCKLHGAIEYDDSTLRQRNQAANDMTSSQLASHTIFTFVNVTLVVAGFVKRGHPQNCSGHSRVSSSLKDLQCIAVCEVDVSSVIQNKYHSPAEWAGCRVTDSHPPANEPCRQTFAAHGRPRLSYREHHWIAPMGLTAAQPGPWLRPVNYSPSQNKQYRPGKATGHPNHPRRSRIRQKRIQVAKPTTG